MDYHLIKFNSTDSIKRINITRQYSYAKCMYSQCNFDWYNVEAGWTFTVGGQECEIPAGQYDVDSLATAIQVEVRAETGDANYTCTYDTDKNRLVLATSTGNFAIASVNSNFARVSGFVANRSGASTYDAENPPNLSLGDVYVLISGLSRGIDTNGQAFSVVIPKSDISSNAVYESLNYSWKITESSRQSFDVRVINEYGLSMDNIDASVMLEFC